MFLLLKTSRFYISTAVLLLLFLGTASPLFAQFPDTSARPRPFMLEPVSGNPHGVVDTNTVALENRKKRLLRKRLDEMNRNQLPFFIDDIMLVGGLSATNIHYSNEFRHLSMRSGFNFGIENYFPLLPKAFLHYGLHYSRANISYQPLDATRANISFGRIDIPIYMAYELPVMRQTDFRIFLGTQLAFRTGSGSIDFPAGFAQPPYPSVYVLNSDNFQRFDYGLNWGLSMEYDKWFWRMRSYIGTRRLFSNDTGMFSAFYLEGGFFLFRHLKGARL
ncbi:MAG: outer membrane beta-barrel protein [Bacteroidia bacterium]